LIVSFHLHESRDTYPDRKCRRPLQYAFRRMFLASNGLRGQDRCHFGHGRYRKQDKTVVCSRLEESVRFAFQDVVVPPSTGSYEPGEGEDTRSLPRGQRRVNQLPERS
jgi:hypothetical protein